MKNDKDQNNRSKTIDTPARHPWSKPTLIDLNVKQTEGKTGVWSTERTTVFKEVQGPS